MRVKNLYATMRHLYERARSSSPPPGWAVHGYDAAGATSPLGGAVTGFAKAYKREKPDALVKAVDFPVAAQTAASPMCWSTRPCAIPAVSKSAMDDWPPLGCRPGRASVPRRGRRTPARCSTPAAVYVVTGAAGSIVSAISADLAAASAAARSTCWT